jgi:vacuolar-type H+-ATPase subunit E/Vma4
LSTSDLKSYIEKGTSSEIEEIFRKADSEAKNIVEDSKQKATALLKEQEQKIVQENLAKKRSELAILRMNQKSELVRVKSNWFDRAFQDAEKKLKELIEEPASSGYKKFLTNIVVEGVSKMKGSKFIIQSDRKTNDLLKKNNITISKEISKTKGKNIELQFEQNPNISLGVIIHSEDKRQYFNNTLDARLAGVRERLGGQVYTLLFKGGD